MTKSLSLAELITCKCIFIFVLPQTSVDGPVRMAMYSCRTIEKGEQLFWNYGMAGSDMEWAESKKKLSRQELIEDVCINSFMLGQS